MNDKNPNQSPAWRRTRYGFAGFWLASLLTGWLGLRLVLFFEFRPAGLGAAEITLAFLSGLQRDFFAALVLTLPLLGWFWLMREGQFARQWHRALFWVGCFVMWSLESFLLFVEYFFFEEFKSRFNTVAVDYLLYPYEVFVNIWQSYHVGVVMVGCALLGLVWVLVAARLFSGMWQRPFPARARLVYLAATAVLALALSPTIRFKGAHVGDDRTLNEIANNGAISFVAAAWTRHLDYAAFYKTIPLDDAYVRARRLLAGRDVQFVETGRSIRRHVGGDPSRPKLNVVLFLEESLGSEFWGSLGRSETLTPEMDKLAAEEGLLFTNIYASGNRTVRGMEGALASFPPLPGDSIVKRDLSDNVETVARILKRDGYATLFVYGGRGLFDGMSPFALRNGYDRFLEHNPPFHDDYPNSTFTTAWGVSDEDIFDRALSEFRQLAKSGQPFFGTILSVSNHKPYTYPKGRIREDPDERRRENAVKYSDYALGKFFREAKQESFWTNTIFVVVADHGARVYGKQSIPIHSYEIPLLMAGPAVVKSPARIGQLGCSLDVAPTILGLLGRPYDTLFFGQDLLKCEPVQGRALLNHNRDIGLLAGERLVVLGLMKTAEFYGGDPKQVDVSLMQEPTEADRHLELDAVALYQVADDLYVHQRYRLDAPQAEAQKQPSKATP